MNISFASMRFLCLSAVLSVAMIFLPQATAHAALTITPNTWNIVGLDSNTPAAGPYRFPVGAKICSDTDTINVVADFVWDDGLDAFSGNTYINLRVGSLTTVTIPSIAAGSCKDAYFEAEVAKLAAAFDKTRKYHITATDVSGTVSTPQPRELYVEHLISQSRNSITDMKLNGVSVAAGGTMTLMVGNTYTIDLIGGTATQGYNQFEDFINFPNTIFQILSVSTTYSADSNTTNAPNPNPALYANACIWDNDPNSPTYRSCIGGDDKAGGNNVVTTYTIKIIGGAGTTQTLNTLLHDFSGSSYHYNADFGAGARFASIVNSTIDKTFAPKTIAPNGTSTITFKLTNPGTDTMTGVNFTDSFPAGMMVASTPSITYNGCGAGTFSPAPTGGATSLSFSGGSVAPNSTCTITIDVTASADGSYTNITGNLFINSTEDTGDNGSDTLTVSSAPACTPGQTLTTWTVPFGAANPPDTTTGGAGSPAINNTGYTATASAQVPAQTSIDNIGSNDSASWLTFNYKTGQYVQFAVDTRNYSAVQMAFQLKNASPSNGPTALNVSYSTDGTNFTALPANTLTPPSTTAWTAESISFTSLTSTTGTTIFRIAGSGAKNDNSGAGLNYDAIAFTGCAYFPPPTLSKSFSPKPIAKGATTSLSFTIDNTTAGNTALTGVEFTDVLPAGLDIATSSSSQCGGTLTTDAATHTITLTGGTLAKNGSCTFSVSVTGTTAGQYTNITSNITATQSGANTTASGYGTDTLTVIAPPALAKGFSPSSIFVGNTSTLAFTITNPNASSALSGISFTDSLPAGLTVASSSSTQCGGTLSATAPSTISFSGGTLAANGSCNFSLTVTGTTAGTKNNVTSTVTSTQGGTGNTASASLVVATLTPSIDLTKQVSTNASGPWTNFVNVNLPGSVYYRFKIYNSGDVSLSTIGITESLGSINPICTWTDPLAPGDTTICISSAVPAVAGSNPNTATAHGTYNAIVYNSTPSTATYATTGLSIDKSATESDFAAGETLHYSYIVKNIGFAPLLGPVTIADDKTTDEACPSVNTVGDFDNYLDVNESVTCTSTYLTTVDDTNAGSITNKATATANTVTSNEDTVTLLYAPPTYSLISSFQAYAQNGQTRVEWSTAQERGTLGFFVERENPIGSGWKRLNNGQMLPGLVTAMQGGDYQLIDAEVTEGQTVRYRLIEREAKGGEHIYGPWRFMIGAQTSKSLATASVNGNNMIAWRNLGQHYAARPHRITAPVQAVKSIRAMQHQKHKESALQEALLASIPSPTIVRLRTGDAGGYRLDAAMLSQSASILGINTDTLINKLKKGTIRIGGVEGQIPYFYNSIDNSLYFTANAYKTFETQENIYHMRQATGTLMTKIDGAGPQAVKPGVFRDTQRFEQNTLDPVAGCCLLPWVHSDEKADYWYWDYLYPPYIASTTFTLQLPEPANHGQGMLKIYLRGASDAVAGNDRQATVSLNGVALQGSVSWDSNAQAVLQAPFDQAALDVAADGLAEMQVQVHGTTLNGADYDFFLIDRMEVKYNRKMRAHQGGIWLRGIKPGTVAVDGFSGNNITVIQNPGTSQAKWRSDVTISPAAIGGNQVSFKATEIADFWVAETSMTAVLEADIPSDLKSTNHAHDYLIIAPRQLQQGATALSDYRSKTLNTKIVWLEDIYDEFSFGRTRSKAIEDFLDYAHNHWTKPPQTVVLLGRGTLDHRNLSGYHESLLPLRLAATPWGLAGSDNRYADVNGDHLPDMLLGRIAVSSDAEALAYVDKLIAYETTFPEAWSMHIALIADDPDLAGDFIANSEEIYNQLLGYGIAAVNISKLYYPQIDVKSSLMNGWGLGYGYVNYIGHGGSTQLAQEGFMQTADVPALNNGSHLPVFAASTCAVGDSTMPGTLSLSDTLVLNSTGGAIAAFSPTGLSFDDQALPLNKYFVDSLLGARTTIGTAAVFAHDKTAARGIDLFMHDIYQISGDPAVSLR